MTRDDQSELPLLLLCAEENEVGLVRLVDELNRAGRAPEVISGVEDEAGLLTAATDRIAGPALFVLCRSPELAGSAVRRLSGLFSARRGPRHRLLVVDLSATDPLAALPSIRAELEESQRASTRSVGENEARAGRVPTRDVVSLPGMAPPAADELAPVPSAEEVERARGEALAKALHDEMVAAEAALSRRDAARSAGRAVAEHPASAGDGGAGTSEPLDEQPSQIAGSAAALAAAELAHAGGPAEDSAADRAAAPVADLLDELMAGGSRAVAAVVGPETEAAGPPRGKSSPNARDDEHRDDEHHDDEHRDDEHEGGLLSSLAGVQVADPLGAVPVPDVVQTELTPTEFRKRRREPKPVVAPDEPAAASRTSPVLFAVAVVAIAALAFMAVMHLSRDPEPTVRRGLPATAAGAPAEKPVVEKPVIEKPVIEKPVIEKPVVEKPVVEKPVVEKPVVEKPASPGEDPSAPEDPSGVDSAGDEDPVGEDSVGEDTPPDGAEPQTPTPPAARDVPPPPVDQEALRIDEAIRSGKIRAIDSLLVAKAGASAIDWDAATRTCKRLKPGGLGGWRLPGRRELSRLQRARMLGSAVYWSRERNDTKDEAHALDAGSGRSNLYLTIEPAARALCVRRR